jgi:hypothetical protein
MPCKRLHATAARCAAEAFRTDPQWADNLQQQYRNGAACSAARAAARKTKDARVMPDRVVLKLRRQAYRWLRADLSAWTRLVAAGQVGRSRLERILRHWQKDADLAGLRDKEALAKLPAEERAAFEKFWADVAVLKSAKANNQRPGVIEQPLEKRPMREQSQLGKDGPKALRRRLEQIRKDIELVARLEAVRLSQANIKDGAFDRTGAAAQYARAFHDHGIDLTTLKPEEAARRLRESSRPRELLAGLDTWRC